MPKKENRIIVVLACKMCKQQNYTTVRKKSTEGATVKGKKSSGKLILMKLCPWCKKHTQHTEAKIRKGKATSRANKKK